MGRNNIKNFQKERGFTIVELLIVIVVIGILAAITIVAYNGVQNRAKVSSAQSAAVSSVKKAEAYNAENSRYPLASTELTAATPDKSYFLTGVAFSTPAAANAPSTLLMRNCGSGNPATQSVITATNVTGTRFYYWDYVNNNMNSYDTAGLDGSGTIACPAT